MGTPAKRKPVVERDTLGKLLARVKAEVRSKANRRYRLPPYYKELSAALQAELRHELETKRYHDWDQEFSFTPEQIGWLVIKFYDGQKVEPL